MGRFRSEWARTRERGSQFVGVGLTTLIQPQARMISDPEWEPLPRFRDVVRNAGRGIGITKNPITGAHVHGREVDGVPHRQESNVIA